jgi:carbon monoxide dehydrogenase subunit G
MQFSDEFMIELPRDEVWAVLRDPRALGACIPGLQDLEVSDGGNAFGGTAMLDLGATKFRVPAQVTWLEQNAPAGGRLQASATLAGYEIEGSGNVNLVERGPDRTQLSWEAQVTIPGPLADNPLMGQVARSFAARFIKSLFDCVQARLESV